VLEREVGQKVVKKLRECGFLCWKIHGGPNQTRGLPDVIFCYQGLFGGIELKTPKTKKNLTINQRVKLMKIKQAGGVAVVIWDPRQVDQLVRICERRISAA
jgi:Holliday junction resolvase